MTQDERRDIFIEQMCLQTGWMEKMVREQKKLNSFLRKLVVNTGAVDEDGWSPAHPYEDDWNALAGVHDWPTVQKLTKRRLAWIKIRETKEDVDLGKKWPLVMRELGRIDPAWAFPGWSFDWLIKAEDNVTRVLEGKFRKRRLQTDNARERFEKRAGG